MKLPRYPALAGALRTTRSTKAANVLALINRTLAANLPSAGVRPSQERPAMMPLRSPRELLAGFSGADQGDHAPDNQMAAVPTGCFTAQSYVGDGKALQYRLYVPQNAKSNAPVVVMLHGCTQSAEDFARGTGMNALADTLGFIVAYPSQTHAANPQKCWNWFKPSDQQRDRGEPAMIAGLTKQIIAEQGCDEARVYIAGLSAGGAAAAVMASAYPDLYAAVGIHSGLACGAAQDIPSALMAMKQGGRPRSAKRMQGSFVPVITFHGDQDATVSEINSREIIAAAANMAGTLTIQAERGQVTNGRNYTCERSATLEGKVVIEQWTIHGGGHAWSGGSLTGSYTDERGPDASAEMMRFFLTHHRGHL